MKERIAEWIACIQKPRVELGGFAVCPYAKLATQPQAYVILTTTVNLIEESLKEVDLKKDLVTVCIVEDYKNYSSEELVTLTIKLNKKYKANDFAILDNDPRTPMYINGVKTTFEDSYLWLIQSLSDLNNKSESLQKTNYYAFWTQKQLDEVVTWRM